jgi:glutathione S-transferase
MKLYNNRPSPYGRKVLVVAHEKRLMERIDLHQVDPWSDPDELLAVTPLGKVPALLTDDVGLITESTAISEYFDAVGSGPQLCSGNRFGVMARTALAQGIIDAAFASVIERRRPAEQQWAAWTARQRRAIERALKLVAVPAAGRFDLGDVTLACALAYLDFRLPEIPWRRANGGLGDWSEAINRRPSMLATVP